MLARWTICTNDHDFDGNRKSKSMLKHDRRTIVVKRTNNDKNSNRRPTTKHQQLQQLPQQRQRQLQPPTHPQERVLPDSISDGKLGQVPTGRGNSIACPSSCHRQHSLRCFCSLKWSRRGGDDKRRGSRGSLACQVFQTHGSSVTHKPVPNLVKYNSRPS